MKDHAPKNTFILHKDPKDPPYKDSNYDYPVRIQVDVVYEDLVKDFTHMVKYEGIRYILLQRNRFFPITMCDGLTTLLKYKIKM